MVLALAGIWLLRRKRRAFFVFIPAVFMLATTGASLVLLAGKYLADPATNLVLLATDLALMAIAAYLLVVGARAAFRYYRQPATRPVPEAAGVER